MSDTPLLDAVESASRRMRGIQEAPRKSDDRSPEQVEADNRKYAEERLARASSTAERVRKDQTKRFSQVKRTLLATVEGLRHGQVLDTAERTELADTVMKDLGGKPDKASILAFVEVSADAIESGDKATAWRSAEHAAEAIAKAGWRPDSTPVEDNRTTEDIVAQIRRA